MQSIVVPYPYNIFTSITVQLNILYFILIFFNMFYCSRLYFTINDKRSGIPSPVTPEVGTNEIY